MQAGDEGGHRKTLRYGDPAEALGREQRAVAGLRLVPRLRPSVADRVQRGAGLNPDECVDDIYIGPWRIYSWHDHPFLVRLQAPGSRPGVTRRDAQQPRRPASSPVPAPPFRPPVRSIAG